MRAPRLLAIAPDGWWADPLFATQLKQLASRWAGRDGAVYLRAHGRSRGWWCHHLAQLPLGLPRGISLPSDREGPLPTLDFLHVPTTAAMPETSLPVSRPWHPQTEPLPPAGAAWLLASPVLPTPSKPGARPLGWEGLRTAAAVCPMPVLALGGLGPDDLAQAQACGAHGVACVRAAWHTDSPASAAPER